MSVAEVEGHVVGLPEAAERLGVHRATVNDMVRSGRLPAQRNGAHWHIDRRDLEAFAASYVKPPNAPARREPGLPASSSQILELLDEFDSASPAELAPFLNLSVGNVRKHLRLMGLAGLVARRDDGQWVRVIG